MNANGRYERGGGFREELQVVRSVGENITTLEGKMQCRALRPEERTALQDLKGALENLREEIVKSRAEAMRVQGKCEIADPETSEAAR